MLIIVWIKIFVLYLYYINHKKRKQMKITQSEKKLIEDYLTYYYSEHIDSKEKLSLKNQLNLLYDYTTHIVK